MEHEAPDDTRAALELVLDPSELVDRTAAAVGCTLVLTDRRLMLIRDGAKFRPKTGVRSWPLDRGLSLRLAKAGNDRGRLVIQYGGRSASVFLTAAQLEGAQALLAETRQRIYAE